MERYFELKQGYLDNLRRRNPTHPHLPLIEADVSQTKATVAWMRRLEASEWTEDELSYEWQRQAMQHAGVFAQELGVEVAAYVEQLPRFQPRPDVYRGRFDRPLLVPVHPEIGLRRMAELVGIHATDLVDDARDWDAGVGFTTPDQSYTTWATTRPEQWIGVSVQETRESLQSDERGGNIFDGIADYNVSGRPSHFVSYSLPGSETADGSRAFYIHCRDSTILRNYEGPHLETIYPEVVPSRAMGIIQALTAGRDVATASQT